MAASGTSVEVYTLELRLNSGPGHLHSQQSRTFSPIEDSHGRSVTRIVFDDPTGCGRRYFSRLVGDGEDWPAFDLAHEEEGERKGGRRNDGSSGHVVSELGIHFIINCLRFASSTDPLCDLRVGGTGASGYIVMRWITRWESGSAWINERSILR